jgi:hypothetical protein
VELIILFGIDPAVKPPAQGFVKLGTGSPSYRRPARQISVKALWEQGYLGLCNLHWEGWSLLLYLGKSTADFPWHLKKPVNWGGIKALSVIE